jgi:hypothetical protein
MRKCVIVRRRRPRTIFRDIRSLGRRVVYVARWPN